MTLHLAPVLPTDPLTVLPPDPAPRIGLWTKLWRWITRRGK